MPVPLHQSLAVFDFRFRNSSEFPSLYALLLALNFLTCCQQSVLSVTLSFMFAQNICIKTDTRQCFCFNWSAILISITFYTYLSTVVFHATWPLSVSSYKLFFFKEFLDVFDRSCLLCNDFCSPLDVAEEGSTGFLNFNILLDSRWCNLLVFLACYFSL